VQLANDLLGIARELDSSLELKYNRFYIGLSKDGRPFNFVLFRPRKSAINLEVKLPRSDDVDHKIEEAGIESLDYDMRWGNYRLSLHKDDISKNRPLLKELMTAAYQGRSA
jgi:predicted transport protein